MDAFSLYITALSCTVIPKLTCIATLIDIATHALESLPPPPDPNDVPDQYVHVVVVVMQSLNQRTKYTDKGDSLTLASNHKINIFMEDVEAHACV